MDLNPLHYINEINEAIGHSTADVLEFLGISNPAVDPDGIRDLARSWNTFGDALDKAHWQTGQALNGLEWEGTSAAAFHTRAKDVRNHCENAAGVLHDGYHHLDQFADQAHELLSQIGVLCAQIIELELAALPLSLLTGPLSEVASTLAAGERATKILALIARIAEAAKTVDRAVDAVLEALGALGRALKALAPIAKMAAGGAAFALGYDAIAAPDRLRHGDTIEEDIEVGALLGIFTGGFGKTVQALLKGFGPRVVPLLAEGGLLGDLSADGDGLSRLAALMRDKENWARLPQEIKDRIRGNRDRGNAFNDRRKESYPYSEVQCEPPADSDLEFVRVDGYDPHVEIVFRRETQLAEIQPKTARSYINEFIKKYPPGTKITSRKGDLHGKTLEGDMIFEVPVQNSPIPLEIIEYADENDITFRDEAGHIYSLDPESPRQGE